MENIRTFLISSPTVRQEIKTLLLSQENWEYKSFKQSARHFLSIYSARLHNLQIGTIKHAEIERLVFKLQLLDPTETIFCHELIGRNFRIVFFSDEAMTSVIAAIEKEVISA